MRLEIGRFKVWLARHAMRDCRFKDWLAMQAMRDCRFKILAGEACDESLQI